ncbi:hypothetical protein LEP1GSC123_4585 [Leptospira borgpetersenii str. 200701203]|uniref:Uncharacterized protein n=1 Tax=Leptospira borgpetersenii str. 200701203 TaxID=1193007 RepID=M3HMV3_LEPBO|nr:hypothetical protein LEP1GSC123_4585 [Leptospira borgpetersenii str. 200701203]
MIISWEKIRHPHPKEEWKKLLEKVNPFVIQEKRGSSHMLSKKHLCIEKKIKKEPHSLFGTTQNQLKRIRVQTRNSFFRFLGNSIP